MQEVHGAERSPARSIAGSFAGEGREVTLRDILGEHLASLARHRLVNPLEPLHEAADVVVAVLVRPDVGDDLGDRPRRLDRLLLGDARRVLEVFQERAIEAVEDGEVVLVGVLLALARAAADHLLEEDAALHRAQEDDELQVGDVHAGGEQVDGHRNARGRPVAELADLLQRTVDAPGDLLHKGVTLAEDIARQVDELVGVTGVREIVHGENEDLRKAPVEPLVLVGVASSPREGSSCWSRGAVTSRSIAVVSNSRSSSSVSIRERPVSGSMTSTFSPSRRKTPRHTDLGANVNGVVVHEEARRARRPRRGTRTPCS